MNTRERLRKFIGYLAITDADFERIVGLSNGAVSKVGDNTRRSTIDRISNAYPELNTAWLMTGEGEMLKVHQNQSGDNSSQFNGNGNTNQINSSETLNKAIDEIAAQRMLVSKSQEQLSKSQEQIDRLLAIIEKITK